MIPSQDMFVKYRVVNGTKFLERNYEVFKLDEVGEIIWNLIDGENSVTDIVNKVASNYGVSEEKVFKDVEGFLKDLSSNNLIELVK